MKVSKTEIEEKFKGCINKAVLENIYSSEAKKGTPPIITSDVDMNDLSINVEGPEKSQSVSITFDLSLKIYLQCFVAPSRGVNYGLMLDREKVNLAISSGSRAAATEMLGDDINTFVEMNLDKLTIKTDLHGLDLSCAFSASVKGNWSRSLY